MKQALDEVDLYLENYSKERNPKIVKWKETLRTIGEICRLEHCHSSTYGGQ